MLVLVIILNNPAPVSDVPAFRLTVGPTILIVAPEATLKVPVFVIAAAPGNLRIPVDALIVPALTTPVFILVVPVPVLLIMLAPRS
jgi:hypothetical protein